MRVSRRKALFHSPFLDSTILWDYESVLTLIKSCRSNVVLVLSGHDHDGGYKEEDGIRFLTLPSPMVCKNKAEDVAHGIVDIFEDHAEVQGRGTVQSMTLPFRAKQ